MSENKGFEKGSFRDRTSRVISQNGKIFRVLDSQAKREWDLLQQQKFYSNLVREKKLIKSTQVPLSTCQFVDETQHEWKALLEHEVIPLISYPYEWSFSMLRDAAILQLEIIEQALDANMILKDASSYNIQWQGCSPVFIDVASFVKLPKGQPWVGYRQFCELYLFPLMFQAYRNIPFQPWLRGSIDGIQAADFSNIMSLRDMLRPGVMMHGVLQAKLQNRYKDSKNNVQSTMREAGFSKELIKHNVLSMKRLIEKMHWKKVNRLGQII